MGFTGFGIYVGVIIIGPDSLIWNGLHLYPLSSVGALKEDVSDFQEIVLPGGKYEKQSRRLE